MTASLDTFGVAVAAAFLVFFLAAAFVAFKLLKRTVKMAVRVAIVGVILAVAIAGSLALLWVGSSKPSRPEPRVIRTR